MKKKSELMCEKLLIVSVSIGIVVGTLCFFYIAIEEGIKIQNLLDYLFYIGFAIGLVTVFSFMVFFGFFVFYILPMSLKEKREDAFRNIKHALNGSNFQQVEYLFNIEDSINEIVDLEALMKHCKCKYIAKVTDNKIDLILLDKDGNKICQKEIYNPLFFEKHFWYL